MAIPVFEDKNTLYRVVVTTSTGYSHSPDYFSEGECYTWIANELFERGAKVEIERVERYEVRNNRLNYFDDYEDNLPYEIRQTAWLNTPAKTVYHDGCVSKHYVDKLVAEIQERLDK